MAKTDHLVDHLVDWRSVSRHQSRSPENGGFARNEGDDYFLWINLPWIQPIEKTQLERQKRFRGFWIVRKGWTTVELT
jgi:hypothetical protein